MTWIDFGRETCCHLPVAERREWLVTNGLGGYACGTVAGLLTRRYHGLLIAALDPPPRRTLLLTKLDETATYDGHDYPLSANRWAHGDVEPAGFHLLLRFHLEGTTPVWSFACADDWPISVDAVDRGLRITAFDGATPFYVLSDAAPPFTPRGCIAQAWSVAELLRICRTLESPSLIPHQRGGC